MNIFWSWQSDTHQPTGRHFVRQALDAAAMQLANHPDLQDAERPEVDSDTSNVPGSPPIAETILRKIRECGVFVADVTPVGVTPGGKKLVNPNVMIELGYALATVGSERIALVMNQGEGAALRALPFDLRHWRGPLSYSLNREADDGRRAEVLTTLTEDLAERLAPSLAFAAGSRPPAAVPQGIPADPEDPAVWKGAYPAVRAVAWPRDQLTDLPLAKGPKLWCRVIPSAPFRATRHEMAEANTGENPLIPLGNYPQLWRGTPPLGAAAWHLDPNAQQLNAITQWIQSTGEIWGVWPDLFTDWKESKAFTDTYAARGLEAFLRAHFATLTRYQAALPWRVIVGVRGLTGSVLPGGRYQGHRVALGDTALFEQMVSEPLPEAVRAVAFGFLREAYDAYGAPALTETAYQAILDER